MFAFVIGGIIYVWAFFQPQPAYQIEYQQMLLNYRPAPIVVQQPTPPLYVQQPPCQVLSPSLTVCPSTVGLLPASR